MAQQQTNESLVAPGFLGLNTQDSPLGMPVQFASQATNCVIDRFGRIASRKGFKFYTTNPSVLGGNPIEQLEEFVLSDGTFYLMAAGNNKLWIQETESPFELVELTLPADYTITANQWDMVSFNDKFFFVQSGHEPLVFNPAVSTTAVAAWDEVPPETTTNKWPNCAHAAYGRLWVGDLDTNSTVVAWSGLLDGENWTTAGVGAIQTEEYWPNGFDNVTAITAHNDFLVIFGENNILMYNTTADVASTLSLNDTIEGIGCVARDSVQPTGIDMLFVDSSGVRSLNRTVQEKSVPVGDLSINVRQDFQSNLSVASVGSIKSIFHVEDSFYAVFLPTNNITYVFDTGQPLPNGAARATTWESIRPRVATRSRDGNTYFAGDLGVYTYAGGEDRFLDPDNSYEETVDPIRMQYFTHPLDFGSSATLVFPKQVDVTVIGGTSGELSLRWGFDYKNPTNISTIDIGGSSPPAVWGGSEWADDVYWTLGQNINELKYNVWGQGRNVKFGFSSDIVGSQISIQEVNIQVLQGRIL